ncbi:MAG TPA: hypothetical protein VGB20_03100 [bacterium]
MPATLQLHPGRLAGALTTGLTRLAEARVFDRIWLQDPALWSDAPDVQDRIRRRLGWVRIPHAMSGRPVRELAEWARSLRELGLTHAVLLGMGGSSLFADVAVRIFGPRAEALALTVLDTTDPAAILAARERLPLADTLAIVSSKSGTTAETNALWRYFEAAFRESGARPGVHCAIVTDSGTPLEQLARTLPARRAYTLDAATGQDIGGRYSALSYFGLVPSALMGLNVERLIASGQRAGAACGPRVALEANPAAALGALMAEGARAGRNKITFLPSPDLEAFGTWAEQLIAESTGKGGQGVVPVVGESRRDPGAYGEDRLLIELQLAGRIDPELRRATDSYIAAGHPVVRIEWEDRYDLGGEAFTWCLATAAAGALLGVNPFDEPDVNATKLHTSGVLSRYERDGRLESPAPLLAHGDLAVYGTGASGATSLAGLLGSFLRQIRSGDYLALLSFLPQTASVSAAVRSLADRLGSRLGVAAFVQTGPRYLHSTGQLHKGGPEAGVFLELTGDDPSDLPIPGARYSFGVLKQAQAFGDFEALRQRGRRLLRVHLSGDPDAALARLARALEDALAPAKPARRR